jgi:predicted nuclease of predicted toxin-antitoxin system
MNGILYDENLPINHQLKTKLKIIGSSSVLGEGATDSQIWNYAKEHDLIILTKDADFYNRIIVSEPPPRVVHLRIGNMRKAKFHKFIANQWENIESLISKHKLVRVYLNKIVGI